MNKNEAFSRVVIDAPLAQVFSPAGVHLTGNT